MRKVLACFLLLVHFGAKGQPIELTEINVLYDLKQNVSVFIDNTRSLSFESIQQQNFIPYDYISDNSEAIHWYRFQLDPKVAARYITLYSWGSEIVDIYIPYREGYSKFTTGRIAKQQINFHRYEQTSVTLNIEKIDFSQPIYMNEYPMSMWGKKSLKKHNSVLLSMNQIYEKDVLYQDSTKSRYISFLSIFFISFVLLLVTYFITKDRNYLNYSLYLLALILMFIGRVPYFYNLLNDIHPRLFLYLNQVMHIATAFTYLYFVDCFVDFKGKSLPMYRLSRATIKGTIIFGILGNALLIINPFMPYRFEAIAIFEIVFTIISLVLFTTLLFKKPTFTETVVLVGSQLLIIGNILTLTLNSNLYFLLTALAEIIAFSTALTIKNKANQIKQLETSFALENERKEKLNLIELDKMRSAFFTNISHEFRTPLSLIKGPIEDQLNENNLSESNSRNLRVAKNNASRMERLVDQLLALAKLESGKLKLNIQPGSVVQFLAAQVESFSFLCSEKDIELTSNIEAHDDIDWFDRDAMEKITTNLLSNAIKYTPEGGKIYVKAAHQGDNFKFSVTNTGAPLSDEELQQVFNRFYQTNAQNQGSGIGLALTKELTILHHGSIHVRRLTSNETQFEVQIPVTKDAFNKDEILATQLHTSLESEPNSESNLEDRSSDDSELPIVLIIDDNYEIRSYLKSIFESYYTVRLASDGEEGLKMATELIPDIIISDVRMPKKDGFVFTSEAKQNELTSHIPIILLSAKDDEGDRVKGIDAGADVYITKPFSSAYLKVNVKNLLESRRKLQARFSKEIILKTQDIPVTSTEQQFVKRLQEVLDEFLTDSNFTTNKFSEEMHMSRMQLHRKLKALTGKSTSEFLRSQRLQAAAKLIEKDKISISEVGYIVGFNDPSYFTKCFKQEFGISPTEYAKK